MACQFFYEIVLCVYLRLKLVFILANSTDTDEMPHYAAFYLGLHCLPNRMSRIGIKNEKGEAHFANVYIRRSHRARCEQT